MAKQRMAIYFGDMPNTGEYDNGVWMDVLKIPYIQNIEEAGNYDIIIRTLWVEATIQGWSKAIRDKFPAVKQIGLSDHPLSTHISKMQADAQIAYLADLQYLDGIMALTEEEREWYTVAVPSIPVVKVGLPFPFDTYEERYGALRESEKKYIGLGVGASDNDRNFISSWIAFRLLKIAHPDLQGVYLSIPQPILQQVNYLTSRAQDVYIQAREEMGEYYDILSQCKFVINLADRNTPGRLQAEAAFFGVPVIGSNRLELQNELFPELSASPYALERTVNLANTLLEDPEWGDLLVEKAVKKLERYNYKSSKRKFNALLREITERG
jgi:hypothetical protein